MFQAEVEDYNGRKRKIVRRAACELSNIQTHFKPYDASVISSQEDVELCRMLHDSLPFTGKGVWRQSAQQSV
jgi:hypothetical protein